MLSFWQFAGIPSKVSTDRAANFAGELTREFLKRIGFTPIFCTPRHPESNSIERTIGTLKSMISKVAQKYPRSWHRYLSLILWAMREAVNETTGVSPFTLVYGRLPYGPLAVLREMWLRISDFATPQNKSTVKYLKDLRERLANALSFAQSHAEKIQQQYVARYNARSCDKSFQVGEPVLVLQKDSTASKVFSRWIGPVVVTHIQSPHSYIVEFEDGSSTVIHANHRKFHTKAQGVTYKMAGLYGEPGVNSCAIVSELDQDFGDLHVYDSHCAVKNADREVDSKLPSQMIDRSTLSHL